MRLARADRVSAIVVPIPVPAPLEAIRQREVASARTGAPAHVTLLVPFVPAAELDEASLVRVATVAEAEPAFEVTFRRVRIWEPSDGAPEGVVWLEPEPSAPFVRLIEALGREFPDFPPYGGFHDTIIPHLTIAADDRRQLDSVAEAAARLLPFRRRVSRAIVIVQGRDGRWRTKRRVRLGGGSLVER